MSPGEVFTAAGALIAFGGLITWVKVLRDHVKELREWRHSVGDRPGFAALVRNEEHERRLVRIERALNGLLRNVPLDPGPKDYR